MTQEPPPAPRRIRTLVVEDSPEALRAVCALLQTNPTVEIVGTAGGGVEATRLAEALQPELVLTDLHMPGRDGLEVVKLLRQQFPAMRLVLISTDSGAVWEELSRLNGADAFVPKHRLPQESEPLLRRLFPTVNSLRTDSQSPTGGTV